MNATLKLPARATLAALAVVLGVLAAPAEAQRAKNGKAAEPVYAGVIVKYKSGSSMRATATSASTMKTVEDRARVKFAAARSGAMDVTVYHFSTRMPAAEARAAAARIALDSNVEYAVPDQVMHALQTTPNDKDYAARQWNLQAADTVVGGSNLPLAWQRTTGSNTVVVAVVDTGVRPGHPDLAGRLLPGYDLISSDAYTALGYPANWNAADGNGRDADATDPGDYVDDALLAMLPANSGVTTHPSSWHGTHVAGIIGAASNNGVGVAGVDWAARILPVRVLGRDGGTTSDIVDGIAWAAGLAVPGVPANPNPARVINLSLGGPGECSAAFQDAVSRARAVGAIVVVASGNEGLQTASQPANCNGVIAVTAHARDGDNASYANVGAQVAISAPGGGCGTFALTDLNGAQDIWDNTCAGCHSLDSRRQQIDARPPMGLTFTKARAALEAALKGTSLSGQPTGMEGLASALPGTQRNDLAGLISMSTCSGPADGVYSTLNLGDTEPGDEGYAAYAGTSMAAPHVSGVVALLLSLSPKLSADEVKSVLQTTARPHPAGSYCAQVKGVCGAGLLDGFAAVDHVVNNRPTVTAGLQGSAVGVPPSASFTLVGTVKTAGGRAAPASGMTWRQTSGPTVSLPTMTGGSITVTAPSASGRLGFEFVATDSVGYSASATATVVINSPPVMSAVAPVSATAKQAISGSVKAVDADGDAITYVAINPPSGFNMNAATGAWTWTPGSSGNYTLGVMPTDAYGNGVPASLQINVAKGAGDGGGGAVPAWVAALLLLALGGARGRRRD
ncbi:MAG TPA: S8 family serine peptidase [Burkholderiaceae bacterium]|nr:S8 family serine peptidase [Burkholderiaceae bacterium]